jgi:hypothetical protein
MNAPGPKPSGKAASLLFGTFGSGHRRKDNVPGLCKFPQGECEDLPVRLSVHMLCQLSRRMVAADDASSEGKRLLISSREACPYRGAVCAGCGETNGGGVVNGKSIDNIDVWMGTSRT